MTLRLPFDLGSRRRHCLTLSDRSPEVLGHVIGRGGGLDRGGPQMPCRILKTAMSHVFVATLFPWMPLVKFLKCSCRIFLLLSCCKGPMSRVKSKKHQCRPVTKSACRMSNLKNGRVHFRGSEPWRWVILSHSNISG